VKNKIVSLALIAGLAACSGGNPFDTTDTGTGGGTDGGTGGSTGGETDGNGITTNGVPPGTTSPTAGSTIFRSEARVDTQGSADYGNGYANSVAYNSANDTFTVNNLPFDGDTPYHRRAGNAVRSLNEGRFNVYEAETLANDPASGDPIKQFTYRAIYGQSTNKAAGSTTTPATQFAIIRTGNYVQYGFGGFVYQRDDAVKLPERLQATYTGKSAGLRDFSTGGGLQYTTADVVIDIDSDDFDEGAGVKGQISNRRIYDLNGQDITSTIANGISGNLTEIPDALFVIQSGVLKESGDIVGEITSQYTDSNGDLVPFEEGNYYAIVSGDGATEIVGVFVLEADGARDTGGFIVYRGDPE